jgi:hypothetical protein
LSKTASHSTKTSSCSLFILAKDEAFIFDFGLILAQLVVLLLQQRPQLHELLIFDVFLIKISLI